MLSKLKQNHWPVFILSALGSGINILLPIILVRYLSTTEMGIYKVYFLYLSAVPFLFLIVGPNNSVYYYVGKEENQRKELIQATWHLTIILSLFALFTGLIFYIPLHQMSGLSHLTYISFLLATLLWMPGGHFVESQIALGKGFQGQLYDIIFQIIKVGGFILIASFGMSLENIFIYYVLVLLFQFICTIFLGNISKTVSFKFKLNRIQEVFHYCFPISISAALMFFLDKIDLFILSTYLSAKDFAIYSLGCFVVGPLLLLDMSVQKVLIPKLSKSHNENKLIYASSEFSKAIANIAFLIVPCVFGLILFAAPIVTLLYTDLYYESVPYLKVFSLSYLLNLIPHDAVLRATGKTSLIMKIYLITAILSVPSVYFAVSQHGSMGALICTLLFKMVPNVFGIYFTLKISKWSLLKLIPFRKLSVFTLLSTVLTILCYGFESFFRSKTSWFFVCAPIFAMIYLYILNLEKVKQFYE